MGLCAMGIGARWGARLCVVECLCWGKAFGPGTGLEKTPVREWCVPKNPCYGGGMESEWKGAEVDCFQKQTCIESQMSLWVEGSPCSPAVYSLVSLPTL